MDGTYAAWEIIGKKSESRRLLIGYHLLATTTAMCSSCRLATSTGFPGERMCVEEGWASRAAFSRISGHDP